MNTLTRAAAPHAWLRRWRFGVLGLAWRMAARIGPWRALALFHHGNLCFAQGRRAAALHAWRLAADSGHRKALHNLGQALVEDQHWHAAAQVCRQLAALDGDVASAYLAAKCQLAAGAAEAARLDFEACVRLDPGHVGALEHLGRLALARRDAAAAQAWLHRALAHAGQPEAIHFLLGVAGELAQDPATALAHYTQVQTEPLSGQARTRIERLQSRPPATPPLPVVPEEHP